MSETPLNYQPQGIDFNAVRAENRQAHRDISAEQNRQLAEQRAAETALVNEHQQALAEAWVGEAPTKDDTHHAVSEREKAVRDLKDYMDSRPTSETEAFVASANAELSRIEDAKQKHEAEQPTSLYELMIAHAKAAKALQQGDKNPAAALTERLEELTSHSSDPIKLTNQYRRAFEAVDTRIARENNIDNTIAGLIEEGSRAKLANAAKVEAAAAKAAAKAAEDEAAATKAAEARAAAEAAHEEGADPELPFDEDEGTPAEEPEAELSDSDPEIKSWAAQAAEEMRKEKEGGTSGPRSWAVAPVSDDDPNHVRVSFGEQSEEAPVSQDEADASLEDIMASQNGGHEAEEAAAAPDEDHEAVGESEGQGSVSAESKQSKTVVGKILQGARRDKTSRARHEDGSRMTIDEIMANTNNAARYANAAPYREPVHRGAPQHLDPELRLRAHPLTQSEAEALKHLPLTDEKRQKAVNKLALDQADEQRAAEQSALNEERDEVMDARKRKKSGWPSLRETFGLTEENSVANRLAAGYEAIRRAWRSPNNAGTRITHQLSVKPEMDRAERAKKQDIKDKKAKMKAVPSR